MLQLCATFFINDPFSRESKETYVFILKTIKKFLHIKAPEYFEIWAYENHPFRSYAKLSEKLTSYPLKCRGTCA